MRVWMSRAVGDAKNSVGHPLAGRFLIRCANCTSRVDGNGGDPNGGQERGPKGAL